MCEMDVAMTTGQEMRMVGTCTSLSYFTGTDISRSLRIAVSGGGGSGVASRG